MLTVAFRPELVALVAGSRYPAPHRATRTSRPSAWSVWMLPVFTVWPGSRKMGVMDCNLLLEMLKCVVRPLRHSFQPIVLHMIWGTMAVG